MKRKLYTELLNFKNHTKGTCALLIEGARRVGKTFLVTEFAKNEYESCIIINFELAPQEVHDAFKDLRHNLDELFFVLELYSNTKLIPRDSETQIAKSIIILDEIQMCPKARSAIKYLVADGRFDIIETGSLISIKENVKDIMIPSEEHALQLNPMDFEEFAWAMGEEQLFEALRTCFIKRKSVSLIHRKAMELFRKYIIVGGMPAAVAKFIETKDFIAADTVKRDILGLYRNDINKFAYTKSLKLKISAAFEAIPGQLSKHEKKYTLSQVKKGARYRDYDDALFWLADSKIVNFCFNATEPNLGLSLSQDRQSFKCYLLDTGLLISMAFDDRKLYEEDLYYKFYLGKLEMNEGMIIENIIAQTLVASGVKLYFFSKYSSDAEERMEIDFLISKTKITSRHNISPIEVKSGKRYTFTSLDKFRAKYPSYLAECFVLHDKDLKVEDGITYLPWYMAGFL